MTHLTGWTKPRQNETRTSKKIVFLPNGFGSIQVFPEGLTYEDLCRLQNLIAAAPHLLKEMERYLPILERAEEMGGGGVWGTLTDGTGIATINGYKAAIAKAKGLHP